jgi:hypothetical protein
VELAQPIPLPPLHSSPVGRDYRAGAPVQHHHVSQSLPKAVHVGAHGSTEGASESAGSLTGDAQVLEASLNWAATAAEEYVEVSTGALGYFR